MIMHHTLVYIMNVLHFLEEVTSKLRRPNVDTDLDIHNSKVFSSGFIIFPPKKVQNILVIKYFVVPGVSPLLKGL